MEKLYLAGGCFWCIGDYFLMQDGVEEVNCGYSGGDEKDATYYDVKAQKTGHRESIEIIYDEKVVSLEKLLEIYLRAIDPYSKNKQGEDEGVQYRTGIYYLDNNDKQIISDYFSKINLKNHMIEILPLRKFFPAEEYHQKYLEKNPHGYCHINFDLLKKEEMK